MIKATSLGFPRIGAHRQLKRALESFWAGVSSESELRAAGRDLRRTHWELQRDLGLYLSTCSMAWLNRMRLDYFNLGAPFGQDERGLTIWIFFRQCSTPN